MSELRVENLRYHTFESVSFVVKSDERLCISGPSGSGKTLLLRALADLDPHSGTVLLNGTDINACSAPQWRRKVAMLPAESQWWADSVGEHFNGFSHELLAEVGFDEDVLEWPTTRLSTGERQRLALVRLLALQPEVLLLDEPTANLDSENASRLENLILNYQKSLDAAAVWVSHSEAQIKRVASQWLQISNKTFLAQEIS